MSVLVLDASATLPWFFSDEETSDSARLLERVATEGAKVPAIWVFEIANALSIAERRGKMSGAQTAESISRLRRMVIEVLPFDTDRTFQAVRILAKRYGLTIYDAAYLDLAVEQRAPLATRDKALATAAISAGVELVPC